MRNTDTLDKLRQAVGEGQGGVCLLLGGPDSTLTMPTLPAGDGAV